ncbi:hypothetical protein O181_028063 [Austropuccinia psidii MF-1]|uniref:Uncharacterized protein n=1 Tax=Austropuccinia psidii MF-1 TaxID=1389203 RepID=A0A9Q3H1G7_9BASI|nr:hypothetical protein [Austropuccinia psidii MF-1]
MPTQGRAQALFRKIKLNNIDEELQAKACLCHCIEEGDKYLSNRFGLLRDQNATGEVPLLSPTSFDSVLLSRSTSFANSSISPPTLSSIHTDTSSQFTQPAVPVPHTPFQSFNDHLSQLALSMFCSKDLIQLDRLYNAVHQLTLKGHYLTADPSSALIETYVRHRQIDRVRQMYVNAHVALASLGSASASDQALKSISWTRFQDRILISLAYDGLLEELAIHNNRLISSGAAPSADAYAAMIQHAHETINDASAALAHFEEDIQHRVTPNTFLCNMIISKLPKDNLL